MALSKNQYNLLVTKPKYTNICDLPNNSKTIILRKLNETQKIQKDNLMKSNKMRNLTNRSHKKKEPKKNSGAEEFNK